MTLCSKNSMLGSQNGPLRASNNVVVVVVVVFVGFCVFLSRKKEE